MKRKERYGGIVEQEIYIQIRRLPPRVIWIDFSISDQRSSLTSLFFVPLMCPVVKGMASTGITSGWEL